MRADIYTGLISLINRERHISMIALMAVIGLYELLSVFYGFELCDSGYYMTFYENIFRAPASVEYNFMYYLSGVAGGAIMWIAPGMGMIGMRLVGVVNNLLIVWLLYKLFSRYIGVEYVIYGCLILFVSFIAMPMTFSYDLLTALLYVVATYLLINGMSDNSYWKVAISGAVIGLNVFTRLPNILGYSLILVAVFYTIYSKSFKNLFKYISSYTLGFIAAIIAVLLFMKIMGHYEIFINCIRDLFSVAQSKTSDVSHGIKHLISIRISCYILIAKALVKLLIPLIIILLGRNIIKNRPLYWVVAVISYASIMAFSIRNDVNVSMYVLCFIGLAYVLVVPNKAIVKSIAIAGAIIAIITPMGSDGLFNSGTIIFAVAAPIAMVFWGRHTQGRIVLLLIAVSCLANMYRAGAYFDAGSLAGKTATIHNSRVENIYTTQNRADVVNDILTGIKPFVKQGDVLFAYGSIPAINYMTGTIPFIGSSWPELLSIEDLRLRLIGAKPPYPPILRQKFNTIGDEWGEPNERYIFNSGVENTTIVNDKKSALVNQFIIVHKYKKAFENRYFILYVVPN